jgi:hypothetical protein
MVNISHMMQGQEKKTRSRTREKTIKGLKVGDLAWPYYHLWSPSLTRCKGQKETKWENGEFIFFPKNVSGTFWDRLRCDILGQPMTLTCDRLKLGAPNTGTWDQLRPKNQGIMGPRGFGGPRGSGDHGDHEASLMMTLKLKKYRMLKFKTEFCHRRPLTTA